MISLRRLKALCKKEAKQIVRDPTTILISFLLSTMMLFIFAYGINLDTGLTKIGVLSEDSSPDAREFVSALSGSPYIEVVLFRSQEDMAKALANSRIRGFVVIPGDFSRSLQRSESAVGMGGHSPAPIQVVTDGSEPNTAGFVLAYVSGAWEHWLKHRAELKGEPVAEGLRVEPVYWFNPAVKSSLFIIPGSITVIMTVIGALLTALVVAREWERGTMEALLASPVTKTEFLLGKIIPYYVLGMLVFILCVLIARYVMGVPFLGSIPAIFVISTLFLLSVLGMGLLISTVLRSQYNAAQITLVVAFLPAVILSGFIFETDGMPWPIKAVSMIIPASYFVDAIKTLSLAGNIWSVLWHSALFLSITAVGFLGLTFRATRKNLD